MKKIVGCCLIGLVVLAIVIPLVPQAKAATWTVTFTAYDPFDYHQLEGSEANSVRCCWDPYTSPEGTTGYVADALLDYDTWDVVDRGPAGNGSSFSGTSKVVWQFPWLTKDTGYSGFFLDNEGAGWNGDATINLNFQLAKDYKKKLDDAVTARGYTGSSKFDNLYNTAVAYLNDAIATENDALKGEYGQKSLNYCVQAWETMMYEHGISWSKSHPSQEFWWGVTYDTVENYAGYDNSLWEAVDGDGWIRIVFDKGKDPPYYADAVNHARSKGLHVMGQLADSSVWGGYNIKNSWPERVNAYVDYFGDNVEAYEIGNEINGSWLGRQRAEKLNYAADYVHDHTENSKVVLCFYWQIGQEKEQYSLFTWIHNNIDNTLKNKLDVVILSVFIEDGPLGATGLYEVFNKLHEEFPGIPVGMGECDYWCPDTTQAWWWHSKENSTTTVRREVLEFYYGSALGFDYSLSGVFWWYYVQEVFPDYENNPLWLTLKSVYDNAQP